MDISAINWLAVLAAAVAAWLFGAAWYMALSKPWMAATKIDPSQGNRSIAPLQLLRVLNKKPYKD